MFLTPVRLSDCLLFPLCQTLFFSCDVTGSEITLSTMLSQGMEMISRAKKKKLRFLLSTVFFFYF